MASLIIPPPFKVGLGVIVAGQAGRILSFTDLQQVEGGWEPRAAMLLVGRGCVGPVALKDLEVKE